MVGGGGQEGLKKKVVVAAAKVLPPGRFPGSANPCQISTYTPAEAGCVGEVGWKGEGGVQNLTSARYPGINTVSGGEVPLPHRLLSEKKQKATPASVQESLLPGDSSAEREMTMRRRQEKRGREEECEEV